MMFRSRSAADQLLPNHLLAAVAQISPSIIVAPGRKRQAAFGFIHDRQIAGFWRCLCVCLCVKGHKVCVEVQLQRVCICVI